ncbi:MAG: right-handed parallel beta-helix repeat-containing protein [Proteobacteria bacterium]|nr:right-handed parallel beta-helix repeat-containing protein [Pseudomonadota bacterium]
MEPGSNSFFTAAVLIVRQYFNSIVPFIILLLLFTGVAMPVQAATYHVTTTGSDDTGNGSLASPWASITHALDSVPDDSVIAVHAGTYNGRVRIRGSFAKGVTVRSEPSYQARLRNNDRVITVYTDSRGATGITLEGFDIAHSGEGSAPLVVHIDGGGNNGVSNITLRNNILHDSYNNDILKVNNACRNILISSNMFYNQTGSDEHIDINSVSDVIVENNIFFNDFEGSGRSNSNDTSSYIVIKDSNGAGDIYTGSRNVTVRRNVFLHWQGSTGSNFILLGEDGQNFYEAYDILVENNLLLGDSPHVMRAPFGVKGGRDIIFRNNTISGDLPALAYAMRLNSEGDNPPNTDISFYNNIWVDQTGSMGAESAQGSNDFSDTPPDQTDSFILSSNLYWNGGQAIPASSSELINYTDDGHRVVANPLLTTPSSVVLPGWDAGSGRFKDGSASIAAAFTNLVTRYGALWSNSPAVNKGDSVHGASEDILGNSRPIGSGSDIGALEFGSRSSTLPVIIAPVTNLLLKDKP